MNKKYSEEFKKEAVRLALTSEQSRAKTAEELGVNKNSLYGWISKYRGCILETNTSQMSVEQQLTELSKENARLREEREILKKFATYCAKDIK